MASCIVVGRIFLSADQELRVEERSVLTSPDFVDGRRVEINKNGTRDVLVVACLVEEGFEGSWITDIGIRIRAAISLQAVLKEIPVEGG